MATQYTDLGYPYPQAADTADGPGALQALADAADDRPGIKVYTGAAISALTAAQKPAGLVVFNSTTQRLQVSDGSTFTDLIGAVGGTMTSPLLLPDGTGANCALGNDGDPNTGIRWPAANSIALVTDGTDRLSIDSAGAVTIGGALTAATVTQTTGSARSVWLPAPSFVAGLVGTPAATLGLVGSWSSCAYAWSLPDGQTNAVTTTFVVPSDYLSGLAIDVYFQGAGSNNFYIGLDIGKATPGTPGGTALTLAAQSAAAAVSSYNGLAKWSPSITVTPAAGDLLNIAANRQGGHGSDTSGNTMYLYGVLVRYLGQ